ncbi:hypothetical protein BJ878DRAFT_555469 [Calycina marina]|uniref:Uncharacterized protein n=1 Tax=Calycina marina TaxID=1763456 RepID=A0A9P7YZ61_9HELO|nr:hypothetical protein BJ878DRAFT_555469 [Calycina marina]
MSNPTSPIQTRDFRSPAVSCKRDRKSAYKSARGVRPVPKPTEDELAGLFASDHVKHWKAAEIPARKIELDLGRTPPKKDSNKASNKPYPTIAFNMPGANARHARKGDALVTAKELTTSPLSRSLMELLPSYNQPTSAGIQSLPADSSIIASMKAASAAETGGVLYSFDNKNSPGKEVPLGGLIDKAEQQWRAKETDRIVKTEYAVLDNQGQETRKGHKTPKPVDVDEDDDFEMIDRYE